jgi:hypothetical protein
MESVLSQTDRLQSGYSVPIFSLRWRLPKGAIGGYCWRRKSERCILPSPSKTNFHLAEVNYLSESGP